MARALAGAGCAIALQDIERDTAEREVDAMKQGGIRAIALGGDISDMALPRTLIDETVKQLGRIDILINNAAVQHRVHWTQLKLEDFERLFRANVAAPI